MIGLGIRVTERSRILSRWLDGCAIADLAAEFECSDREIEALLCLAVRIHLMPRSKKEVKRMVARYVHSNPPNVKLAQLWELICYVNAKDLRAELPNWVMPEFRRLALSAISEQMQGEDQ